MGGSRLGTLADLYLLHMSKRDRALFLEEEDKIVGWLTFFVCGWDDVERFHKRPMFSMMDDDYENEVIYIDKLISLHWNKDFRNTVVSVLHELHPKAKWIVWHRPTKTVDRQAAIRIRK